VHQQQHVCSLASILLDWHGPWHCVHRSETGAMTTPACTLKVEVHKISAPDQAAAIAATRYIDESLLNAVGLHHDLRGDFNQVVLLPDALDTRPFRLPWLPGTVIYVVASAEHHEECKWLLKVRTVEQRSPWCRSQLLRSQWSLLAGTLFHSLEK
jgi:Leucine carboxyl methyltransferase